MKNDMRPEDLYTCKNCKWWWPNRSPQNKSRSLDPRCDDGIHWGCENELLQCEIGATGKPSGLSSYEWVGTGPDFGCVHWQVKLPF